MFTALELLVCFTILVIIFGSITKPIFLIKFIRTNMINPKVKDQKRINEIFEPNKRYKRLIKIFHWILIQKIRIYLRKNRKNAKFINLVNILIENIYKYTIDQPSLKKKLVKIIEKHDLYLANSLKSYTSHKAEPLVKLFRFLNEMEKIDLPLTFNAGQEVLIKVFGEPLVHSELLVFKTEKSIFQEIEKFFGREKDFILQLYNFAA